MTTVSMMKPKEANQLDGPMQQQDMMQKKKISLVVPDELVLLGLLRFLSVGEVLLLSCAAKQFDQAKKLTLPKRIWFEAANDFFFVLNLNFSVN